MFLWRSDESDGSSPVPPSPSSSNSVDVVFEMVGAFEVDNQDDGRNVKTSGTDTGSNHYV